MKLQAVLIGSGTEEDPFRVDLPTWVMVDVDYGRMEAIVSVPDDVYPLSGDFDVVKVKDSRGVDHDIVIPRRGMADVWHAIEEEKYPQYASRRRVRDVIRVR